MPKKLTTEEFIEKAKEVHGDRYDYSLVEYKGTGTKVKIICREHGVFEQVANSHLQRYGCPACGVRKRGYARRRLIDEFIEKAKEVHGDIYDYSLVKYMGNKVKVKIICEKHGVFWQTPNTHLQGAGCPVCAGTKKLTTEEFIEKAKEVHGDRYDYSLVEYRNSKSKVKIVCKAHGVFEQVPNSHLQGNGCSACSGKKKYTTASFIEKAREVHGNRYGYSLVTYKNTGTKVKIICNEHGVFEQTPKSHLLGGGCPICNASRRELLVDKCLTTNNIEFIPQYRVEGCKHKYTLPFDFFIPGKDVYIECQGQQHYEPIGFFGGQKAFKSLQKRDRIKRQYCEANGFTLVELPYWLTDEEAEEILEKTFKKVI